MVRDIDQIHQGKRGRRERQHVDKTGGYATLWESATSDSGWEDVVCGIAGYVGPDARCRADDVRAALVTLRHRGPDSEGWYEDDEAVLGVRRLAIVGLVGGDQPVYDEAWRRIVVCNGEVYNHTELRAELARRHSLASTSDVAVIPHLHEDDPEGFLSRLRGMFALALWDARERRLVLARDRLGKKPLFWSRSSTGGIAFASELPGLREIVGHRHAFDPIALHHYVALGMIPGPRTVYKGISALPVAGRLDCARGRDGPVVRVWGESPRQPTHSMSHNDALLDEIDARIAEAVRIRLRSDVPIGVLLSGGIDSGLVAAHAVMAGAQDLLAFIVRTVDPRYDESRLARLTASRLGLAVHEITLGDVDEATVLAVATGFGQPFGDSSAVPLWLLCQAVAPYRKAVLTGDGGDEIFAGYRRYTLARWLSSLPLPGVHWLTPKGHRRHGALGFLRRMARVWASKPATAYQLLTTDLATPDVMQRLFPDLASNEAAAELRELVPQDPYADGGGALMLADRRLLLPWIYLPKMDIASMASSLEARSPLLDTELMAFAEAIPRSIVIGRRTTKPLLRALARRHLPAAVISAPKLGFGVPVDRWLAGPLRPLVESTLLAAEARIGEFSDISAVRNVVERRSDFAGNRPQLTWLLLMLELFLRQNGRF